MILTSLPTLTRSFVSWTSVIWERWFFCLCVWTRKQIHLVSLKQVARENITLFRNHFSSGHKELAKVRTGTEHYLINPLEAVAKLRWCHQRCVTTLVSPTGSEHLDTAWECREQGENQRLRSLSFVNLFPPSNWKVTLFPIRLSKTGTWLGHNWDGFSLPEKLFSLLPSDTGGASANVVSTNYSQRDVEYLVHGPV